MSDQWRVAGNVKSYARSGMAGDFSVFSGCCLRHAGGRKTPFYPKTSKGRIF